MTRDSHEHPRSMHRVAGSRGCPNSRACSHSALVAVAIAASCGASQTTAGSLSAPDRIADGRGLLLIDRSFVRTSIERFGVQGDEIVFSPSPTGRPSDGAGERRIPLKDCLVVLREQSAGGAALPVANFADGQRMPGEPRVMDALGKRKLVWHHRWLGEMDLAPDQLRSLILIPFGQSEGHSGGEGPPENGFRPGTQASVHARSLPSFRDGDDLRQGATSDVLFLANGDRIEGLVEELGATFTVDRSLASAGVDGNQSSSPGDASGKSGATPAARSEGLLEVPIVRIASVAFMTPSSDVGGPRVWCEDGTIVRATPVTSSSAGMLELHRSASMPPEKAEGASQPGGAATNAPALPFDEVIGFVPDPSRLVALSSMSVSKVSSSGETPRFHLEGPVPALGGPPTESGPEARDSAGGNLGGSVLVGTWPASASPQTFRGPIRVSYHLPVEHCTLIGSVQPASPDPQWTDFELIVWDGDREALRVHMTAQTPAQELTVPLTTRELTIEIAEGEGGPIRDAAEIRRGLVVLPATSGR
jgi:hypothetical protein